MMGGQVGLADHVNVGSGAMLGAQSGYMSDVPPGARWSVLRQCRSANS